LGRREKGIVADHLHAEGEAETAELCSGRAQTDHAQSLSTQLQANVPKPVTSTDLAAGLGHSPGQDDRSTRGVPSHGAGVQATTVDQVNAAFAQRFDIYVVQPSAQPADHPKLWRRSQQLPVHAGVVSNDKALGAANLAPQIFAACPEVRLL